MIDVFYAGSGEKACWVWTWGNSRYLSKGIKTAIGTKDAPPTIPAMPAPPRWLPTGWQFKPSQAASCTACDPAVLPHLIVGQDRDLIVAICNDMMTPRAWGLHLHEAAAIFSNFHDSDLKGPPLYVAAGEGSLKCVLLLLEAGADKEKGQVETGATPLYIAARNGHLEVVRLLVELG